MISRRTLDGLVVIGIAVFVVVTMVSGVGLAASEDCEAGAETTICIDDLTVSDDYLIMGEKGEFSLTITNHAEETKTVVPLLYTAGPDNETDAYQMEEVTLEPGASETVTQPIDATTPGTHGLRITLVDPATGERYDTSEIKTLEVREEAPAELGGPIDKTEIALVALVGSLLGLVALGYRQLQG